MTPPGFGHPESRRRAKKQNDGLARKKEKKTNSASAARTQEGVRESTAAIFPRNGHTDTVDH